jgi:hypothetical protein
MSPVIRIAPSAAPCAAVEQRCAAAALGLRHPDRVELAARRIDRRFRCAESETREQQARCVRADRRDGLEETPEHGRGCDHDARLETVGEHAAGNLHHRVGPEEGGEDEPLHRRADIELLGNERHRDGQRRAVDVVDRDEAQHDDENLPANGGFAHRQCGNTGC